MPVAAISNAAVGLNGSEQIAREAVARSAGNDRERNAGAPQRRMRRR